MTLMPSGLLIRPPEKAVAFSWLEYICELEKPVAGDALILVRGENGEIHVGVHHAMKLTKHYFVIDHVSRKHKDRRACLSISCYHHYDHIIIGPGPYLRIYSSL